MKGKNLFLSIIGTKVYPARIPPNSWAVNDVQTKANPFLSLPKMAKIRIVLQIPARKSVAEIAFHP